MVTGLHCIALQWLLRKYQHTESDKQKLTKTLEPEQAKSLILAISLSYWNNWHIFVRYMQLTNGFRGTRSYHI